MLISGDCAGEEIIDILCSVSNDKFAKNGAQKCCHPERTRLVTKVKPFLTHNQPQILL